MNLSSLIHTNIEVTTKQNWNGYDLVQLNNLYLAEDYNKFITLNDVITCISGMSTSSFIIFFDTLPSCIIDIVSSEYKFVPSLNNKTGDIYGVSGIIINNKTYWPTEENHYIVNLGNYLSASTKLVYTYNNISGAVSGVSSINQKKPNKFGFLDFGNYYQDTISVVESINGLSGDISGIVGFLINNDTITYTDINGGKLNLNIPIQEFMNEYYDFLPISGALFYGHPTTILTLDDINDNNIINIEYLKSRIKDNYLKIETKQLQQQNNNIFYAYFDGGFKQFLNCFYYKGNIINLLNLNYYFSDIQIETEIDKIDPVKIIFYKKENISLPTSIHNLYITVLK